jgi:indolepyruvate ferredoxin oxidoreductase
VVELPKTLAEKIAFRADHLRAFQGRRLAKRYRRMVDGIEDEALREAVALGYHKLLAYKDEYEVARLLLMTRDKAGAEFEGDFAMTFHLAPPIMGGTGADGRPKKRAFSERMVVMLRLLRAMKGLRGTPLDPFGRSAERRMERALIRQYESDMKEVLGKFTPDTGDAVVALAKLPLQIRGFGPVKLASEATAAKRREELLAAIRSGGAPLAEAAE